MKNHATQPTQPTAEFDAFATDYDAALDQGLSVSGEDKTYFAEGRIAWLAGQLRRRGERPRALLDFGCGTGTAAPFLLDRIGGAETVLGVEVSARSLEVARQTCDPRRTRFELIGEYAPNGEIDLAYCNGVFHHIPPGAQRTEAVRYVFDALRPGGLFAFWENNPWNPGTRYVMSRIPFDRDAVTLTPPEARGLLRAGGFEVLRTDFLFLFPRALAPLRFLEPLVSRLPLGAQYQILARKPDR